VFCDLLHPPLLVSPFSNVLSSAFLSDAHFAHASFRLEYSAPRGKCLVSTPAFRRKKSIHHCFRHACHEQRSQPLHLSISPMPVFFLRLQSTLAPTFDTSSRGPSRSRGLPVLPTPKPRCKLGQKRGFCLIPVSRLGLRCLPSFPLPPPPLVTPDPSFLLTSSI